jgi:gamma-glutamyltranspeptidase / glutathione hydrolase
VSRRPGEPDKARHRYAVASPHRVASQVGADVLRAGGNALDAAIATNAMLGVVYPHMCGIGGDLFLLYYSAADGQVYCLNGSGPAPRLASRQAYWDRGLQAVPAHGPLAVTVPGTVGAWDAALTRFGRRSLADLLAPAADAAAGGIDVTEKLAAWIERSTDELANDRAARVRFFDAGGRALRPGATLRQPDLARTLRRLMHDGARELYEGEIAAEIDTAFQHADGFLRRSDLAAYRPQWVDPISTAYRGLEVVTTPPNSQGVTALMMLNALAVLGASEHPPGSAAHVAALVRAKRAAFADRDRYIADPAFVEAPIEELLALDHGRASLASSPPVPTTSNAGDTVYVCATDAEGNACSLIQSLYYGFGSCFIPGDTGVLLHNRGHYFILGDEHPNRLEPGKRPLHTLMACLAFDRGRLRWVFGTMGADGQPQINVQVLERLLAGMSPQEAVAAPRVLHGRFTVEDDPDVLSVERGLGSPTIEQLTGWGYNPQVLSDHDERLGHAHAIELHSDGTITAGSDPRSDGAAIVG